MKVKAAQLCPTVCDPMEYTVHGILQARILEWVAFSFSRGSSQPRDSTQVSCIASGFFTSWASVDQKSCTIWELRIMFYLGQNEHFSPGDSTSDSSKRLLKGGSEGRSIYKILVKEELNAIKCLFYERFSARNLYHHEGIYQFFHIWRDARTGIVSTLNSP